jgi:hypothetical protein
MTTTNANPAEQAPCSKATRVTCAGTMIAMMRAPDGATAGEMGAAVGWQKHSVRGFIARTFKRRSDVKVLRARGEAGTRYRLVDRPAS